MVCLAVVGLGIAICILPGLTMIAFGVALATLGAAGFVSLHIMEGKNSNQVAYGGTIPLLFRFFRKKRARQFCPICGAHLRFIVGLGPYAGMKGGWFCSNCRKEVSPPTRSPEFRRQQRDLRKLTRS